MTTTQPVHCSSHTASSAVLLHYLCRRGNGLERALILQLCTAVPSSTLTFTAQSSSAVCSMQYAMKSMVRRMHQVWSMHWGAACSLQYAMRSMQYAVCNVQCAVSSAQYAMRSMHLQCAVPGNGLECTKYEVCTRVQYAVCNVQYAVCSVHCREMAWNGRWRAVKGGARHTETEHATDATWVFNDQSKVGETHH